jgi:predicted acyl esterase
MKKVMALMAGLLVAGAARAEPRIYTLPVSMGAAAGNTGTLAGVRGRLVEIHASASDGNSTGNVFIAYLPVDGKQAAINVATGAVAGVKVWRPTVDATDVAGVALTSDPPGCFYLAGETIRVIVTESPTNKTWKATIKVDR